MEKNLLLLGCRVLMLELDPKTCTSTQYLLWVSIAIGSLYDLASELHAGELVEKPTSNRSASWLLVIRLLNTRTANKCRPPI